MSESNEFDIAKEIAGKLKGVDKAQQEKILRWVSEAIGLQTPTPLTGEVIQPKVEESATAHTDIRAFTNSKNPSSDVQLATVVAYFYRFVARADNRKESINKEVLTEAIRQSGKKQPKSANMTLVHAKNQGYLDSVGNGEYRINSVGENLVAMTLGDGENKTILSSRQRNKVKKRKKPAKR